LKAYKFKERGEAAMKTGEYHLKNITLFFAFAFVFAYLLIYSGTAAGAMLEGLKISAAVLIPSLFPLSVVSGMIVRLEIAEPVCRRAGKAFKAFFRVSENCVLPFVLGIAGGYPLGVIVAADMYKNGRISRGDLKKIVLFCSNCSPAFIVGVAAPYLSNTGAGFAATKIALVLLSAHIFAAVFVGFLFSRLYFHSDEESRQKYDGAPKKTYSFSSAFIESVETSAISMLRLAAYISLFYMLNKLLLSTNIFIIFTDINNFVNIKAFVSGILEFSTGVLALDMLLKSLPVAAFLISFGGLCVAAQSASVLNGTGVKIRHYIFAKLAQGVMAYIIVSLILLI